VLVHFHLLFLFVDLSNPTCFVFLVKNKYMDLKLEQVLVGHETWCESNTRVNSRLQNIRRELESSQKSQVVEVDVNVDDIQKLFAEKGQGSHMLLMDFDPTTAGPVLEPSFRTGKDVLVWVWKHKLTGAEVRRYLTSSKKGYDTGVLSRYLRSLKETKNKAAYERAKLILALNSKKGEMVDLTVPSSTSKPALSRETLLKQWVSCVVFDLCLFLFPCFSHNLSCRFGDLSFLVSFFCRHFI
jgi:hypothetical protein